MDLFVATLALPASARSCAFPFPGNEPTKLAKLNQVLLSIIRNYSGGTGARLMRVTPG